MADPVTAARPPGGGSGGSAGAGSGDDPSSGGTPDRSRLRDAFGEPYRVPVLVTAATSLGLTVAFLLLPLAGTDLSAQVARGHFFEEYGFRPIDFRWYGGVYPFGYSALTGPANALLGSRGVGAVSCVVSAVAFAWLLVRTGVRRPLLGGVLGAVTGVFNLVSGRTTFALGIAFGICALCALALPAPEHRVLPAREHRALPARVHRVLLARVHRVLLAPGPRGRLALAAALAALSSMGSPVAGVFTGLCGAALLLAGRVRDGLALGVGAGLALVPLVLLFRDGGVQPFGGESMKVALAVSVATFFLVPREHRVLRAGAALSAAATLLTFYLDSPLGSNVIRLPMLFAVPMVAAVATLDRRRLAVVLAGMVWWQPPLVGGDLGNAGDRPARRMFYQSLVGELERRGPVGRVEVVPLHDHWEATYVAEEVPVARGWLRQVDVGRNALFYDGSLTPATYLTWLYDNAVAYVAYPRGARLDFSGRAEAALVEADLPYLERVWEDGDWILYRVVGAPPMVDYPARLVDSGPTGVRFEVPEAAQVSVRVRWSRWLVLEGPSGCVRPQGEWVAVSARRAGTYRLTSSLDPTRSGRC